MCVLPTPSTPHTHTHTYFPESFRPVWMRRLLSLCEGTIKGKIHSFYTDQPQHGDTDTVSPHSTDWSRRGLRRRPVRGELGGLHGSDFPQRLVWTKIWGIWSPHLEPAVAPEASPRGYRPEPAGTRLASLHAPPASVGPEARTLSLVHWLSSDH